MTLDPMLLEILVDPEDKQPLWYVKDEALLYNPRLRRAYVVKDNIPVMMIDEAVAIDDGEAKRLEAKLDHAIQTGQSTSKS